MSSTQTSSYPLLLVDDDVEVLASWELVLNSNGIDNLHLCSDGRSAWNILSRCSVGVVVLDLNMPQIKGDELLVTIRERYPEVPIIISTGANKVDTAVRCMRAGAADYLVKPVAEADMLLAVRRALELRELRSENTRLSRRVLADTLERPEAFTSIITCSPLMRSLFKYVEAISESSKPVAILGETGVGKELLASAIHSLSGRSGKFTALNVAGLDDNVFADTLFGHVRGAFTGADGVRKGLIETAAHGTLFLDEIGDLSLHSQVKLLRLLQEREYFPLGADVARISTTSIVVATNRDLRAMVDSGQFRRDLFYRLQVHPIQVPSLRDRPEDIPLLLEHFVEKAAISMGKTKPSVSAGLLAHLSTYSFPGNIRELEALAHDAVARHTGGALTVESIASVAPGLIDETLKSTDSAPGASFTDHQRLPTLREGARLLIKEAMRRANGNQSVAAKLLGISQPSLSRRLKHFVTDPVD